VIIEDVQSVLLKVIDDDAPRCSAKACDRQAECGEMLPVPRRLNPCAGFRR
jgi:hypothetical protein